MARLDYVEITFRFEDEWQFSMAAWFSHGRRGSVQGTSEHKLLRKHHWDVVPWSSLDPCGALRRAPRL